MCESTPYRTNSQNGETSVNKRKIIVNPTKIGLFCVCVAATAILSLFAWQSVLSPNAGRVDYCYAEKDHAHISKDGESLKVESFVNIVGHVPWRHDRILCTIKISDDPERLRAATKSACEGESLR